MKYRLTAAGALLLALVCSSRSSVGQTAAGTTGRQATPSEAGKAPEPKEIPSPMLLEISLGEKNGGKALADPSVKGRTYYETKGFVCDKAQVTKVTVIKREKKGGGIDLEVTPVLKTGWPRQDVDLRVALIGAEKEVQAKTWDHLTIGADDSTANKLTALSPIAGFAASSSKMPIAVFSFAKGEFEALDTPKLRLIVTID